MYIEKNREPRDGSLRGAEEKRAPLAIPPEWDELKPTLQGTEEVTIDSVEEDL
jgi:hypothetical protein